MLVECGGKHGTVSDKDYTYKVFYFREMQLLRTVELSGMRKHCDFDTQVTLEDGSRPDMLIQLTNNRYIVVDSKAPLTAYSEGIQTADEMRAEECFRKHAQALRAHIKALNQKSYGSKRLHNGMYPLEFVCLFLPSESLYSTVLQYDTDIIEYAVSQQVYITSPTTLIALLKLIDKGWKSAEVTKNSLELQQLGVEMYSRIGSLTNHIQSLGKQLERSVGSYNDVIGAFESRVFVTAKKFQKFVPSTDAQDETIKSLTPLANSNIKTISSKVIAEQSVTGK